MENYISPTFPQWMLDYQALTQGSQPDLAFTSLKKLSQEDIANRAKEIRRLQRTSGYGMAMDELKWQLDPIPFLMPREDWQFLHQAICQRLLLLQQIKTDLLGEQRLISDGLISPRHFMTHPAYLPEASQFSPDTMLIAGFDIARETSGQFTLIRDHLQFPTGLGVQLENRIISRRVMSEEFSELGIARIAQFLKRIQDTINMMARDNKEPRVIILTEGPNNPDYTEQAYLATFMDMILARSADLTVREGKVWIKALDGLRQVDVIIRWIPDNLLDSLEQPLYSEMGVPGLFMALRAGNVTLINGPGSSMLQIPSVHHAIPTIAEHWLNQPLMLPQLATQTYTQEQQTLEGYELKHYKQSNWQATPENMQKASADDLYWQRKPQLSVAPYWTNTGLQAKPHFFRCFAFWDGQHVSVMPAALCATTEPIQGKASGIKDTWIYAEGPVAPAPPLVNSLPVTGEDIALIEGLIPSRAAENLFWLGTGLERCESIIRLLRVYVDRFTEVALYPDEKNSWSLNTFQTGILNQTLVYPYLSSSAAPVENSSITHKSLVWQSMSGTAEPGTLCNAIELVLTSAKQIRELLSYDSIRILDNLQLIQQSLKKLTKEAPLHQLQSILDNVIAQIMAFNGSIFDSLAANSGAFMMDIGRRLERSSQLTASLHTMLIHAPKDRENMGALDAVLLTQVSAVTHRRRYRIKHNVETGLELLIVDSHYPRSLAYQIEQMLTLSEHLPSHKRQGFLTTPTKLLLQLKAQCALAEPAELAAVSAKETREALSQFLTTTHNTLEQFKERLQIRYFSHTQPATKLAWLEIGASQEQSS